MKTWFHIGYPKAGSSLLQKSFFAKHSQINFLGRIPVSNTGTGTKTEAHPYLFNTALQDLHDRLVSPVWSESDLVDFRNLIEQLKKPDKINFLSSEFITSIFFAHPNLEEKLMRLKKLGVDGVLIVIRNQVELIKSQYREHPFHPGDLVHGKPIDIDNWVTESHKLKPSYLQSLKFSETFDLCSKIFGTKNVHLLPFKELINQPELTATKFQSWFSLDPNESLTLLSESKVENQGVSARYNKVRNFKKNVMGEFPISNYVPERLIKIIKSILKRGKKEEYRFSEETISFLNEYFRISNFKLDLNLKEYRYPPYYKS